MEKIIKENNQNRNLEKTLNSQRTGNNNFSFYDFNKKYLKFNDSTLVGLGGESMIGNNFGLYGAVAGAIFGMAIFNYIEYKRQIDSSPN